MPHLNVRNRAQQVLFEKELKGQISDGMWENTRPDDHWQVWSGATIRVAESAETLGRNFYAQKDNYNFTSRDLLDVVGDRMIEYVRTELDWPVYDMAMLKADLADLKQIVRIQRRPTEQEQADDRAFLAAEEQRRLNVQKLKEELADRVDVLIGGYTSPHGSSASISWSRLKQLLELAEKAAAREEVTA